MDVHHAFTLDRELGATASGALLPAAALTAIHWAHRLFAGVVLVVVGSFGIQLLGQRRLSGHGLVVLAALAGQISLASPTCCCSCPCRWRSPTTRAALLLCAVLAACARVFQCSEARGRIPAAGFPRRFEAVR
jgi:cytochrome c oxidase assembly protein subunit 15